jgi:hypothetical protein
MANLIRPIGTTNLQVPILPPSYYVHTLEQLGKSECGGCFQAEKKKLQKRAKVVFASKEVARHLTKLNSPLNKAYRRTLFECNQTIVQDGKKLTTKYCGSRWCTTCNRLRTAKLMKGYMPSVEQMNQPYLVTLTIPNVLEAELKHSLVGMVETFNQVKKALKRLKMPFNGIRKLEATYNAETDTYHPHIHVILESKEVASMVVERWLLKYKNASMKGQDVRPITDANGVKELFKYTTKIVTNVTTNETNERRIFIPALDVIFKAMKGMRTFQSFGDVTKIKEDVSKVETETFNHLQEEFNIYEWLGCDWLSIGDGNLLSNYQPSETIKNLLRTCMLTLPPN